MLMNIYVGKGHKVKFVGKNGRDYERRDALRVLEIGKIYTVETVDIYSSCSDVYLQEFPDKSFNAAMFEEIEE